MKIIDANAIDSTLAHNDVPRRALIKVGDGKSGLQTVNDAHLEPGRGFKPHTHDDCEEVYYFLEGTGIMKIDDKDIAVRSGMCLLVDVGESHGLENTGSTHLRFITIRVKV